MKHLRTSKGLAGLLSICLLVAGAFGALAENASTADFEVLHPVMDLVAGAVMVATETTNEPEPVPGEEGTLSTAFVTALFGLGQSADASLGLGADALQNTEAQSAFLSKLFAAKIPDLQPITQTEAVNGHIGFLPVTVNSGIGDGGIQILGELYWADKPMGQLSDEEYEQVQWLDERGIFSFRSDDTALNGFRLTGFTVGTDLSMEMALQNYTEEILVEYVNTKLGFSIQYPRVFTDELLVEDSTGVSATLADGSASFFAKRMENTDKAALEDYVNVIANGIPGATSAVSEFQWGTVSYTTEEGFNVFDVYIVTNQHIYQAELSYRSDLSIQYDMFTTYLENTFLVHESSLG